MEEFIDKTLRLLDLEHQAELEESLAVRAKSSFSTLRREGILVTKLEACDEQIELYGRVLIDFTKSTLHQITHKLTPGDVVGVFSNDITVPEYTGVVYKVKPDTITVAFDSYDRDGGKVNIVLLPNDVTHKKQVAAIKSLSNLSSQEPCYRLYNVLMGNEPPTYSSNPSKISQINPNLNHSQVESINFTLFQCSDLGIIHGPPGTGKTTTVVELIQQCVALGMKVLATAPSNIAIDNIAEKLVGKVKLCRIGHPARMLETITHYCFDNLVKSSDQYSLANDIKGEIKKALDKRTKTKERSERAALIQEVKILRKELRTRQSKAMFEVYKKSDVILATNIGAGDKILKNFAKEIGGFDICIIDEAAQGLEASCWVPILLSKRLVLAGDHKQLPPTIKSQQASDSGLDITLMDRLCRLYPESCKMLEIQYRMHQDIMAWSSAEFYDNRLIADESVRSHTLDNLEEGPLILIDTAGCDMGDEGDESKLNRGEASIVSEFVKELKECGVNDIAVITPYSAQVELLRSMISNVEISTVDGFQGREKDAVVISMVRSNPSHNVGFLQDARRMNVAVTRARKLLCIVCDSETVGSNSSPDFLKNLMRYLNEQADIRGVDAWYRDNPNVEFNRGEIFKEEEKVNRESKKIGNKPVSVQVVEKRSQVKGPIEYQQFQAVIQEIRKFKQDPKSIDYTTPPLEGRFRYQVHVLCDSLNLFHKSMGSSKKRSIYISKQSNILPKQPSSKVELKQLIESSSESEPEETKQVTQISTRIIPIKKEVETVNEEELLNQIIQDNTVCIFQGCSKNIKLIRHDCPHCKKSFCLHHGQAEVHGCGAQAREKARRVQLQSTSKPKPLKETDRKLLLDKLHEKTQRNPPPKNKKKRR